MGVRERLATWLMPRNAGTISVADPSAFVTTAYGYEAGVPISAETALQVSAVYGCCRLIVDSLAAAPVRVFEVKPGGVRELLHDDPSSYVLNWGASPSIFPDAPSAQAVEEALLWSSLLQGNGYAEIQRDAAGRFVALWPLEPDRVKPVRDESGRYVYEITTPTGGTVRVDPARIFHLRGPSLYGWVGDSTVYRAAKAIGIAQASQVFSAAYFGNGGILSGVLKYAGKLTPEQKDKFAASWKQQFGGPSKSNKTAILDQGLDYVAVNHDAQKSQLVEARRFQVAEIARFFGVPTTLLADNEAWTNLSEIYNGFFRNALLPWASRFDAEATRKIWPERKPWREAQHDLTELVMGSFKDRVATLKEAVSGGLQTRNEARSLLGLNTLGPDGDVVVCDGNVKPLEDVLDPPEPKPALAAVPPPEDDEDEDDDETPARVARMAVALDRFARKIEQRRKDVERKAPEKLEENLTALRAEALPALLDECRKAAGRIDNVEKFEDAVTKAAESVLAGEPAHLAAHRMVRT